MILLCVVWALVQLGRGRIERALSTGRTTVSISRTAVHVSTTALNDIPRRVLDQIPTWAQTGRRRRRRLGTYWDVGTLVVLVAFVLAQAVLVLALVQALVVLFDPAPAPSPSSARRRVEKRAPVPVPPAAAARELVLRPVVPGWTTSWASVGPIAVALAASQAYHEWGHALCATSAAAAIEPAATGAYVFLGVVPTLYVALPATPAMSSRTALRVAAAGVWHNLHLVAAAYLAMGTDHGGRGWSEETLKRLGILTDVERGVRVVSVTDNNSPLSTLLGSSRRLREEPTLITHLDDLELDSAASSSMASSPVRLFHDYLVGNGEREGYDNLGWCLERDRFRPLLEGGGGRGPDDQDAPDCCRPPSPSSRATANSTMATHDVCFRTTAVGGDEGEVRGRLGACLDPAALVRPLDNHTHDEDARRRSRCLDQASCDVEGRGEVCARIGSDIVRIGIETAVGSTSTAKMRDVVIWKGSRTELARLVDVSGTVPGFWAVFTLSLTLAFFNLLPLPFLDGSHILSSVLACLAASSSRSVSLLPTTRRQVRNEDSVNDDSDSSSDRESSSTRRRRGPLETVLDRLAKTTTTMTRERGDLVHRAAERWTVVCGASLLVVTVAVYAREYVRQL
ncbi:hypothetical protein JCM11491_003897 [Sporobolomyces phaffii]